MHSLLSKNSKSIGPLLNCLLCEVPVTLNLTLNSFKVCAVSHSSAPDYVKHLLALTVKYTWVDDIKKNGQSYAQLDDEAGTQISERYAT